VVQDPDVNRPPFIDADVGLSTIAGDDQKIFVVRPDDDKRLPHLEQLPDCPATPSPVSVVHLSKESNQISLPDQERQVVERALSSVKLLAERIKTATPTFQSTSEPHFAGYSLRPAKGDDGNPIQIDTGIQVVFRSPEGLIRFLGQYLCATSGSNCPSYTSSSKEHTYLLGDPSCRTQEVDLAKKKEAEAKAAAGNNTANNPQQQGEKTPEEVRCEQPLFSVEDHPKHPLVSANSLNTNYFINKDNPNFYRSMTILGLVEELIDLQKSSTTTPVTVPVHVVQ
jgi:hypothetical protein